MKLPVVVLVALALSVGSAFAEPPGAKDKAKTKDVKAKKANLSVAPAAKKPAKKPPQRIDLFPKSVLGASPRTPEKGRRLTLGDDSDWRVQAAQVGAMAAIFGTLAALCHGGKCMVPEAATNMLPSWMRASEQFVPNPRPPQKLRQGR